MTSRHPFRQVVGGDEGSAATGPEPLDTVNPPLETSDEEGPAYDEGFEQPDYGSEEPMASPPASPITRMMPWLTLGLAVLWTGFFLYAHQSSLATGLTSAAMTSLVGDWALPMVLIAVAWLLVMRSSAREAHRFGSVAASLDQQSRMLQERLAIVNRELGLARDFLGAESRELEFLGRNAVERIGEHARQLQEMVYANGAQVEAIASVSATALDNMTRLRQDLPVVAASARDMTNQIANTGRSAGEQITQLTVQFSGLNEAFAAHEDSVERLRVRTGEAVAEAAGHVDALALSAASRLSTLQTNTQEFRRTMELQEEEALAAIKTRAGRLGAELTAYHARLAEQEDGHLARLDERMVETRHKITALHTQITDEASRADRSGQERMDALRESVGAVLAELEQLERQADAASTHRIAVLRDSIGNVDQILHRRENALAANLAERERAWSEAEEAALERLQARMATLDADLAARRKQEIAHTLLLTEHSEVVVGRLDAAAQQLLEVTERTGAAQSDIEEGLVRLTERLGGTRELIDEADAALSAAAAVGAELNQILETLNASKGELLRDAHQTVDQLAIAEQQGREVASLLGAASMQGDALRVALENAERSGTALSHTLEAVDGSGFARLSAVREELSVLEAEWLTGAERMDSSMRGTLSAVRSDLAASFEAEQEVQKARIVELASSLAEKTAAAIAAALDEHGGVVTNDLANRIDAASQAGNAAMGALRDQLARVSELTGNLEARIARARELSEEQIDDDFSRRVSQITERLNSTAIDLDKFLATDVSEEAWASYLKGQRGIFTRRAVRLLEIREAREIGELYNTDVEFRGHVNRYVHDFEAMLRPLLSTRDGHALSVTILSSDMGKLYVALAQAIERLR